MSTHTHTHTHSLSNRGPQAKAKKRIAEAAADYEAANFEDLRRNGDKRSPKPKPNAQDSSPQMDIEALKTLDLVQFNIHKEIKFVKLITELASTEALHITTAIQEASWELKISTETAKRYLIKHTARHAEFKLEGNIVKIRG